MESVSEGVYAANLAIFSKPQADVSILRREWVEVRPTGVLTDGSAVTFDVKGGEAYIDLKNTRIRTTVKVVGANGEDIPVTAKVGVINHLLHSMWNQVDLRIQNTTIHPVGPYYPYKSFLDTITTATKEEQDTQLALSLYTKDYGTDMDDTDPTSVNNLGLRERFQMTSGSKLVEMVGKLNIDFFNQERLLLNGIPIQVSLIPSRDRFTLMTKDNKVEFKLKIVSVSLDVCMAHIAPCIALGQQTALLHANALYPTMQSHLNTFTIDRGHRTGWSDNLFLGKIPDKLYVCMVASAAYEGSFQRNPFNFQHFNLSYLSFLLNNQSVPAQPLQPQFDDKLYASSYDTLFTPQNKPNITYRNYREGYAIFALQVASHFKNKIQPIEQRGNGRLLLKFDKPLPEHITVIVYGIFNSVVQIIGDRSVLQ